MDHNGDKDYWQLIWDKFRAGDRQAFETIYYEFVDILFAYGSKLTPDRYLLEDSVQDLFIDIYTYGKSLRQPEYLEFYLFKTLKRIIIRKLKEIDRFKMSGEITNNFELRFPVEEIEQDEKQLDDRLRLLQKELLNLDVTKRELIFLKFNSGLTYKEIGKLLEINPETAKKQVYRLIKFMRGKFGASFLELFTICCKV